MRKIFAILFICLFGLSQYARHISYLECKILNIVKPVNTRCDCEKQVGFEKSGEDPSSLPKAHLHIHPDEFFTGPGELFSFNLTPSPFINSRFFAADELEGNYPNPWQPPNC